MKIHFEKREKIVTGGLLALLVATSQTEKMRKEYKFAKKLMEKFDGEITEINLKPDEVKLISGILRTVIADGNSILPENQLPKMKTEDVKTCSNLLTKLEK